MKRYLALVLLVLACGCQIVTEDGSRFGMKITTGEVGVEFYHEAKETSGRGLARTDIDQGVQQWLFGEDTDGDGEPDTSAEPEDTE